MINTQNIWQQHNNTTTNNSCGYAMPVSPEYYSLYMGYKS